jgi:predicted transcriptional regulator
VINKAEDRYEKEETLPLHYEKSDIEGNGTCKPINLPKNITGDLAEEVGIHISDGQMRKDRVFYYGHAEDDRPYLLHRVRPLLKGLFGHENVSFNEHEEQTLIELVMFSRKLVRFKNKVFGLPIGKKKGITIPNRVFGHRGMVKRVLCGLFDGDGSLSFKSKWGMGHNYPVISYSSISEPLMRQLQKQLRSLGFVIPKKLWERNNGTWYLAINGDRNYERWMNMIGFNNPKHLTKVVLYEHFGMVPPNTGLVERVNLIQGVIELSALYPVDTLRVNTNRTTEKEVLEALAEGENYIEGLGRLTTLAAHCVKTTLTRLFKRGLVEREKEKRGAKKYYRITQWGVNKLNRVEKILTRLREEFNLAV